MFANKALASMATTTLFVLLWSSGAIVSKWGLTHASPFAFLLFRFLLALAALAILIPALGYKLPASRASMRFALMTGAVLLGAYQICYLLALDMKVAPGVMATIMGVQPILTAVLVERSRSASRMFGLSLGLAGLVLVVWQGIGDGGSLAGMAFGVLGMLSMTGGSDVNVVCIGEQGYGSLATLGSAERRLPCTHKANEFSESTLYTSNFIMSITAREVLI